MKKKLLALALIMVVAVGGLFAAELDESVTATLKGNVPSELQHGFTVGELKYQSTYEVVGDVFKMEYVDLPYGYRINSEEGFTGSLVVGPFQHENETAIKIPIDMIQVGAAPAIDLTDPEVNTMGVINYTGSEVGSFVEESLIIRIYIPAIPEEQAAGNYKSLITISIDGQ